MDGHGQGASAENSGRGSLSGPGMRFNPDSGQFEREEEEEYMDPINEIQKRIDDLVAAQAQEKDAEAKKKKFADAHKKMVIDLADQLRRVADSKAARVIEDEIFALLPQVADAPASDAGTVESRLTLAYHHSVMSVDMPQETIDSLLGFFRVGYLHPIIYEFLREKGDDKDNAHKLMMYVAKVLNILYSPALLEILQKAYSVDQISDEDYIDIVNGLNLLVKYTCSSIHNNDTFSSKLIGYLEGLELNDLIAALKKIAGMTVAVLTIDELYPGLFPLFSLGCKATGFVITYVMLAPGILFVQGSFIVYDWEGTCEKVVAAKNAIISCIPPDQLNQVPPPVVAPAAAAQPADQHIGELPAVARSCQAAADRISALSADAVVHPGVSFFRDDTLAARFEGAVRRIIQTSAQVLGGAANIFINNPVTAVARSATTHVSEFVGKIVTGMRDSQCARKQHAVGTYEDNVSLLEMLLTDINEFPEKMRENVKALIYYLSYETRFLSESMVKYLVALDYMTHPDDMFPLGKRPHADDPNSQTAVAGSPPGVLVRRAVDEEARNWPHQIEGHQLSGEPWEIHPFSMFNRQDELPQYSPSEFELWGKHLLKLQEKGQAAPPDQQKQWQGLDDKPLMGPFTRFLAESRKANPLFTDPIRRAIDIPELKPFLDKFDKAAATALKKGTLEQAVKSAKAASSISQAAACARGGGGIEDESVVGSDSEEDGMVVLAAAEERKVRQKSGKSRRKSRKNSKKTIRRNKGRKSSNTAKKSQQQRARNSIRRRRSSRKSRK